MGSHEETTQDDDNDGLTDDEEITLGTNTKLMDSDFDTLSDYQEVYITKTNPTKDNTDNDRYNDFDDEEPLITNSANVSVNFKDANVTLAELIDAGIWFYDMYNNPTEMLYLIASTDFSKQNNQKLVIITNTGNDYSSYVSFDIVTYGVTIANEEGEGLLCEEKEKKLWEGKVDSITFTFSDEPVDEGESIEKTIQFETKIIDEWVEFPEDCRNIFCSCKTVYLYQIENIEYENFV